MEAQGNLNEEQLDDGQAAQILADFNGNDIENQAPINHIDDTRGDRDPQIRQKVTKKSQKR